MYALFAVINNTKKVKDVIKKLNEIGIKGATVFDTVGSSKYSNSYLSTRPAIGSALRAVNDTDSDYSKTIVSIVYCERHVKEAIDAIEKVVAGDMKKPGSGIVFTVPVLDFKGGELGKYLNNKDSQ